MLHEDEAAYILAGVCLNDGMAITGEPREGKIEIKAQADGLLKVDDRRLTAVNSLGEMMIATRHGNFPVKKGDGHSGHESDTSNDRGGKDGQGKGRLRRKAASEDIAF